MQSLRRFGDGFALLVSALLIRPVSSEHDTGPLRFFAGALVWVSGAAHRLALDFDGTARLR